MTLSRTRLSRYALLFGIAFALALVTSEPGRATTTVTVSGIVTVLSVDAPDGSGYTTYALNGDDLPGGRVELQAGAGLEGGLGRFDGLSGRRVTVSGTYAGGAFVVESIVSGDVPAAPLAGTTKWAVLLCKFSDKPGEPQAKSFFEGLFGPASGATYPTMQHYYEEVSYGLIDLGTTTVVGWYTLPKPYSYYATSGTDYQDWINKLIEDCTGLADPDVDFNDVYGIQIMVNDTYGVGLGGGGITQTARDGRTFFFATWMPTWAWGSQGVMAHETGHAYGLSHSGTTNQPDYGSLWDSMSNPYGPAVDPYGSVGQHYIAEHKERLGWIPAARRYTYPGGTHTISLERIAQPGGGGFLLAVVEAGDAHYTIEARKKVGYDSNLPGNAVILHSAANGWENPRFIDGDDDDDTADAEAMWIPGEEYTFSNGVKVHVDTETATGFVVTLTETTDPALTTLVLKDATDSSTTKTDRPTVKVELPAATDDYGVTGYFLSQSAATPAPDAAGWKKSPPASFVLKGSNGQKTVRAWAKDAAGNVSAPVQAKIMLDVDAQAPTAKLTVAAFARERKVAVTVSGADNKSVTAYFLSQSPTTPKKNQAGWKVAKPKTFVLSSGDGAKNLFLWTKDAAGNISKPAKGKTFLDTKAPAPKIASPKNNAKVAALTGISGTVADGAKSSGLQKAEFAILRRADCSWWNPKKSTLVKGDCAKPMYFAMTAKAAWSANVGRLDDPGSYQLFVRFTDRAGNVMARLVVGANTVKFVVG